MGVFARGWLGCAFSCSRGCLRFLGVGALAWGGGAFCVPPPLALLACLRAHALVWAALTCARFCVPDGRRAAMLGRDMIVPPHAEWRWAAFGRPVARRERERCGVWGALMVC